LKGDHLDNSTKRQVLDKHLKDLSTIGWAEQGIKAIKSQTSNVLSVWKCSKDTDEDLLSFERNITDKQNILINTDDPKEFCTKTYSLSDVHCRYSVALAHVSMRNLKSRSTWQDAHQYAWRAYEQLSLGKERAREYYEKVVHLERKKHWTAKRRITMSKMVLGMVNFSVTLLALVYLFIVTMLSPFGKKQTKRPSLKHVIVA